MPNFPTANPGPIQLGDWAKPFADRRSEGFWSLTNGEVDEIVDLLVQTYDFCGNDTAALQEWLAENDLRLPAHQIYNLLVLGRTAWEDIRREAAEAAGY